MPRLQLRQVKTKAGSKPVTSESTFSKNDTVKVIAGRDKGKTGPRAAAWTTRDGQGAGGGRQMVKRHTRPNPAKQIKGGIAERESPIAVSNVMIMCPQCGPSRIGHHVDDAPAGRARPDAGLPEVRADAWTTEER